MLSISSSDPSWPRPDDGMSSSSPSVGLEVTALLFAGLCPPKYNFVTVNTTMTWMPKIKQNINIWISSTPYHVSCLGIFGGTILVLFAIVVVMATDILWGCASIASINPVNRRPQRTRVSYSYSVAHHGRTETWIEQSKSSIVYIISPAQWLENNKAFRGECFHYLITDLPNWWWIHLRSNYDVACRVHRSRCACGADNICLWHKRLLGVERSTDFILIAGAARSGVYIRMSLCSCGSETQLEYPVCLSLPVVCEH